MFRKGQPRKEAVLANAGRTAAQDDAGAARLYPLTFEPVFKDYVWGGRRLAQLGRRLPPEGPVAESWEIAAHEDVPGTTTTLTGGREAR